MHTLTLFSPANGMFERRVEETREPRGNLRALRFIFNRTDEVECFINY